MGSKAAFKINFDNTVTVIIIIMKSNHGAEFFVNTSLLILAPTLAVQ
jgi:hypothetical protein